MGDSDHDIGFAQELGELKGLMQGSNLRLDGIVAEQCSIKDMLRDNTNAINARITLCTNEKDGRIRLIENAMTLLKGKLAIISIVVAALVSATVAWGGRLLSKVLG